MPKGPLKATLEAQEELITQEDEVVEEIQVAEIELESIAKMSGHEAAHEHSEEEDVKKDFKEMKRMVKLMYEYFMAKDVGEGSKHPHKEESSNSKNEEERSSKSNGRKPPPSPPWYIIIILIRIFIFQIHYKNSCPYSFQDPKRQEFFT